MSRSSACDRVASPSSRPSRERGQVEPTAALVATLVVCLGVSLYAVTLDSAVGDSERDLATPTLERVHEHVAVGGVVVPGRRHWALRAGPTGYDVNLTLSVADRRWTAGPAAPAAADVATRSASVRLRPGRVRPGTLRVGVWA